MSNGSRWPAVAVLCLAAVSACRQSPAGNAASPSTAPSPPVMTVNQLMHGILFPAANTVFYAQADDPAAVPRDPMPSSSTNSLSGLYGGWQAVENSALVLVESADLMLTPGRMCENGEVVDVGNEDWIRFVADYREKSLAAYEAALTKNQDTMVDASGYLSEACLACHRVYRREPTPGITTQRCIPGAPTR
ncbi:MAG TPA: hypothetical protein VM692_09280 [Gammaproteobacteria bacterium]|nr:hypothetical protein [Gammaproteobacteria bacterium]